LKKVKEFEKIENRPKAGNFCYRALVVLKQSFRSNFGVKAAEIADHKSIRIALIRMDLRSLAVDDLSELSRSKFHQKLCLRTTSAL